jgi:outer membrane protein TolC
MKKILFLSTLIISGYTFTTAFAQETFTLNESIGYALEHSKTVLSAREKLKDAKGQEISAFAGFIPSLSISGSLMTIKEAQTLSFPMGGSMIDMTFRAKDTYSYGFSVQQNLFTSGKLINGYGISRANMRATEAEYRKAKGDTIFETTKSFYNLLLAQKMAELMEDTYKQTEQRVEQVKAYYDNGIVSKLDLLRVQVQFLNLKTQLTRVKNGLTLAEEAFKMTIGISAETKIKLEGEFKFEEIPVNTDDAVESALKNKPDLKMLKEREIIVRKSLAIAIEGNGPNIVGIYSSQRTKPYNFLDAWGDDWNIILQLQWPIGLSGYGKIKSSKAQLEQIKLGLQQLKDATVLEIKQTCMTLQQEKENIGIQQENIGLAEEALKIAEERYKQGIISNLEYMDTQIALTQSKTNYFQAIADYAIAKAQLLKATGE